MTVRCSDCGKDIKKCACAGRYEYIPYPWEKQELKPEETKVETAELKEVKPEVKEEVKPEQINFKKMTVAELEQYCRDNDIQGYSDKKKADIIEIIKKSGH